MSDLLPGDKIAAFLVSALPTAPSTGCVSPVARTLATEREGAFSLSCDMLLQLQRHWGVEGMGSKLCNMMVHVHGVGCTSSL